MLAWGKNFMGLTDLFLDYFPGYNKFRAVSMILIIAEFTIPLLGFIAFTIGCYVYYLSRNKQLNDQQVKIRKRVMNFCLVIALICVCYSWL